jgi:pimeloyl-ACP methyl ester carboxylesterase
MIEDFESSGLIDLAAKNHRVIVFDRPGFGHSDRPRDVVWPHGRGSRGHGAARGAHAFGCDRP